MTSTQVIKYSDMWSETQKRTMLAIADAVVPSLNAEEAARVMTALPATATPRQRELVMQFAREGYMDRPEMLDIFARQAQASLSTSVLNQINLLLSVLGTRAGTFALTGHVNAYPDLDRKTREAVVLSWLNSPVKLLRMAGQGLKGLSLICWYRFYDMPSEAIGFPQGKADDWTKAAPSERASAYYPYRFENEKVDAAPQDAELTFDADVVIIGSGSGGGVAAAHLAQRGLKVLVVEKSTYVTPDQMLGREDASWREMYEAHGLMPTEDAAVNILAGSTFGGGSTINWSASLKPRHFVRQSWATRHGVPYYMTAAFSQDLNHVCKRMGVSAANIKHNTPNSLLALGALRAGHPVEAVPQNTGGFTHYCGKCQFGCVSGHKQGGVMTWLRDAAETGNASFLLRTDVERVLFDSKDKLRATGALATVDGRRVTLRARHGVVVSAGSLQTPGVLLRTPELRFNRLIGKTLHLHPTTIVTGFYDFPINPYDGGHLTMVSNAAELVDPEGWGAKIEIIASAPSVFAGFSNWAGAEESKADMLRYRHSVTIIIITRDRECGEVFLDSEGKARVLYPFSKHDRRSMIRGVQHAIDIHMMAGASKLSTAQVGVPSFEPKAARGAPASLMPETTQIAGTTHASEAVPRDMADPDFLAWRNQVEKAGCAPLWVTIGSAHQMGSCRMGGSPKTSALDPEGRVWGTKGLYVADASALPEATGVNPMVTTMATANMVARTVAADAGVFADSPGASIAANAGGAGSPSVPAPTTPRSRSAYQVPPSPSTSQQEAVLAAATPKQPKGARL